ncbi:MAG: zinc finger domain-containing protein [Fimbriiglobus sp.]
MSEPVPCPNCQALLRLPEGATTVRCPGCKAVLELDPGDEPAPPPPPPPPTKTAIPLPFGRAKPVAPPPPPPVAAPVRGKVVKARVVADDPYEGKPTSNKPNAEEDDEEREREIRRKLKEIEAEDRVKQAQYDELDQECQRAQIGMKLLGYACAGGTIATLSPVLFIIGSLTAILLMPVLALVALALVGHWVCAIIGFGYCISGPKEMRGTAIVGLVFCLAHILFNALSIVAFVAPLVAIDTLNDRDRAEMYLFANLLVTNTMCNMTVIADLPYYILYAGNTSWFVFLILLIAAGFEFAKISCIGMLGNQYASEGKDVELAHQSMRFVYRIFAVVTLGPIMKLMVSLFAPIPIMWIPLLLGSAGYYLWMAFAWYMQYVTAFDIRDILTATRFTDKRRRIDVL